ncbi:MAG: hypothetical protein ACXWLM_09010, partial [Myxococcales bacterium]
GDLQAAGAAWWRPPFVWSRIEPEILAAEDVETYSRLARWSEIDLLVDGAARAGIRLAVVLGCGYSVQLPKTPAGRFLPDAAGRRRYLDRLSLHARAVVRRYRGRVAMYQLENELNIAGETGFFGWRHGRAWWSRAFQDDVIRVLHDAVRAEDPQAETTHNISADIKPIPGIYSWKDDARRWAGLLDVIGIDAYPNYLLGWPNRAAVVAGKVRAALALGLGKPVVVLESGFPARPARRLFSEARQAAYYAALVPAVRAAGASGLFLYALTSPEQGIDDPRWEGKGTRFPQEVERYWGVVRRDGSRRPAFESFLSSARHAADERR